MTWGQRYRAFKRAVLAASNGRCVACGAPARHPHHIIPVSQTRIHALLAIDPANGMALCDNCHCLMHPNFRRYPWIALRIGRSHALTG